MRKEYQMTKKAVRLIDDIQESHGPGASVPMILHCPQCGHRHIDEGEFALKSHHTHACQVCGLVWRPAKVNTHGVMFLPGFNNKDLPG